MTHESLHEAFRKISAQNPHTWRQIAICNTRLRYFSALSTGKISQLTRFSMEKSLIEESHTWKGKKMKNRGVKMCLPAAAAAPNLN